MIKNILSSNNNTPTEELYSNLDLAYEHFNRKLFAGQLPVCLITMQRKANTFGYFSAMRWAQFKLITPNETVQSDTTTTTHEIALNPAYFAGRPIIEVFQTLVHEMVHLWQFEFGTPSIKTYHNKEWADKMESIGLMPSATGLPGGKRTGQNMADYPIKGGLFYNECLSLCTSGFRLNWIDRAYVPAVREHVLQISSGDSEHDEAESNESNDSTSMTEALLYTTVETVIESTKPDVPSSKQAHQCKQCGQKAWGKATLKLICGVCKIPMT